MTSLPLSWQFGRVAARVLVFGLPLDLLLSIPPAVDAVNASATGRMIWLWIVGAQAIAGIVAFGTSSAAVGYLSPAAQVVWRRRLKAYPGIASLWLFLSSSAARAIEHPRAPA